MVGPLLLSPTFANMSSTPTFNPLACAAIHNEIVSRIATSARDEHNNVIVHNYFAAFDDADDVRSRLSEPLIVFLENIDVPMGEQAVNIAPHARLSSPENLWGAIGGLNVFDRGDHENWVALYRGRLEAIRVKQLPPSLKIWYHARRQSMLTFPQRHCRRKRFIFRPRLERMHLAEGARSLAGSVVCTAASFLSRL